MGESAITTVSCLKGFGVLALFYVFPSSLPRSGKLSNLPKMANQSKNFALASKQMLRTKRVNKSRALASQLPLVEE